MKTVFVFTVFVAALVTALPRPDDEFYDPRFDNFDVEELISNKRLLKGYSHCFIGDGNCTPDGKNFKKWIPDAIKSDCRKCSPKQKVMAAKVIKAIRADLPEEWGKLYKLYGVADKGEDQINAFLKEYAP